MYRFSFVMEFAFWLVVVLSILAPQAHSLICTTYNITNKNYTNCADLPTLNSYIHWNFQPSISTLSIAFTAPLGKPEGWVAWAFNPNGTGMIGAQAMVAFKQSSGRLVVKTYRITSYTVLVVSPLDFEVWEISAEASPKLGVITIFATMELPKNVDSLNQVWQVGPAVYDGVPILHDMDPANLKSKGPLNLMGGGESHHGAKISILHLLIPIVTLISLSLALWRCLLSNLKKGNIHAAPQPVQREISEVVGDVVRDQVEGNLSDFVNDVISNLPV